MRHTALLSLGDVICEGDNGYLIALEHCGAQRYRCARYDLGSTRVDLAETAVRDIDTSPEVPTPQQARHALFGYYAALRSAHPYQRAADKAAVNEMARPVLADVLARERIELADLIVARDGCTGHREACLFGRDHQWCIGHYDGHGRWHTTMICASCSGVCDAELMLDDEVCDCGTSNPHVMGPSPFAVRG